MQPRIDTRTKQQKQDQKDLWHYNFTNHTPHATVLPRIEGLRSAAMAMADAIIDMTPQGREQSLALTACENMLMHSVSALARTYTTDNPDFVDPEQDNESSTE